MKERAREELTSIHERVPRGALHSTARLLQTDKRYPSKTTTWSNQEQSHTDTYVLASGPPKRAFTSRRPLSTSRCRRQALRYIQINQRCMVVVTDSLLKEDMGSSVIPRRAAVGTGEKTHEDGRQHTLQQARTTSRSSRCAACEVSHSLWSGVSRGTICR